MMRPILEPNINQPATITDAFDALKTATRELNRAVLESMRTGDGHPFTEGTYYLIQGHEVTEVTLSFSDVIQSFDDSMQDVMVKKKENKYATSVDALDLFRDESSAWKTIGHRLRNQRDHLNQKIQRIEEQYGID